MIAVRQSRCTRYRFRYSECRRCADACPHDAVVFSDDGASVSESRCRQCALCTSACRTGALESTEVMRVDLLKRAIRSPAWSFACAPSGAQADAIVPCLGVLDAAVLGYLGKRGIPVELRGAGHCAACEHGSRGAALVEAMLEAVSLLREASGGEWAALDVPADDEAGRAARRTDFAPGRRHLFRRLLGGAAYEVARAGDPVAAPEPVPDKAIRAARPFVPESRELLQIIARGREGEGFRLGEHEGLPVMGIGMGQGCTACEACFRACPAGALQVRESDATWALAFRIDACVGCGTCLEVCQPRALRAQASFDISPAAGEVALRTLSRQRCSRCDRFFTSPAPRSECAVCADDEMAFDAIFG
jgi:ferredoxin